MHCTRICLAKRLYKFLIILIVLIIKWLKKLIQSLCETNAWAVHKSLYEYTYCTMHAELLQAGWVKAANKASNHIFDKHSLFLSLLSLSLIFFYFFKFIYLFIYFFFAHGVLIPLPDSLIHHREISFASHTASFCHYLW